MSVLVCDCPHCGARGAAFAITASVQQPGKPLHNGYGSCPICFMPIAAVVEAGQSLTNLHGDLGAKRPDAILQAVFPTRQPSKSPEHVPDAAARAFVQGADSLMDGRTTAAVAMFRRTIDVATKQFSDEVQAWNLEKRIDRLAKEGLITKDLQTWAHKIRLEGNDALHELDEPTREQASELLLFTELMLTYMYTLPAKVKVNLPVEPAAA